MSQSSPTPEDRSLSARIAANTRWALEPDRAKATAPGRAGLRRKFERQVDPGGILPPDEVERRVNSLIRAHMNRMALAASKARRAKRSKDPDAA